MEKDPINIGKRIRKIRKELGLTLEEFAKEIDEKAKSGTVSNWETGKNIPNASRLKRISEIGDVSIEYLISGTRSLEDLTAKEKEVLLEEVIKIEKKNSYTLDVKISSLKKNELAIFEKIYLNAAIDYMNQGNSVNVIKMTEILKTLEKISIESFDENQLKDMKFTLFRYIEEIIDSYTRITE